MNAALIFLLAFATTTAVAPQQAKQQHVHQTQTGMASWYGEESKKTASGERYNCHALTAAHRTLPLGTMLQVRNLANGQTVTVKVNDRGPYCKGRILDLSKAAAEQLQMTHSGTTRVELVVLSD